MKPGQRAKVLIKVLAMHVCVSACVCVHSPEDVNGELLFDHVANSPAPDNGQDPPSAPRSAKRERTDDDAGDAAAGGDGRRVRRRATPPGHGSAFDR